MSEETRQPRSNAYERAHMEPAVRQRQTGPALFMVGALLFAFAWILVVFVPSDIRAGDHFWIYVFGIDLILSLILMGIGHRTRVREKTTLSV